MPPLALGFHAAASAKTRQLAGAKHELKVQHEEASDALAVPDDWRTAVTDSINKTTAYLPDSLRPQALRPLVPILPSANLCGAQFKTGPLDDHGSDQYMFKLVCTPIDYELWPRKIRRSGTGSTAAPRKWPARCR